MSGKLQVQKIQGNLTLNFTYRYIKTFNHKLIFNVLKIVFVQDKITNIQLYTCPLIVMFFNSKDFFTCLHKDIHKGLLLLIFY